ncbi:zinc finger protein 674 isoform X2 [Gadus morhua]|uniref:zinc finger protein 674 isoform X2 n=1 Tax=Gadus morhua TaxID=8049 RepID=UPI0011B5714C|nr:zinc finger protein 674-like isoform X2 [Gadus morhua]XP_056458333.1 zinc finger protein 674-like isoform X2 [Gadus chalcogrammus]XP_059921087.1 zinc finger protein 674-like isoform X2 [Gadus macrocephalus]
MMQSLRVFLNARLTAAAEEIFGAVEKTISDYKEEICRSKDLEISRLRMQIKILKSVEASETPHCETDEGSSMEQEQPEPSLLVKKEQQKATHREFWMSPDEEQLDGLDSDIKDFISSPSSLKNNLQDAVLPFHPYQNNGEENKDRPYCCSVCEKRFSNCSHLAAHIRTHTGERPYRCDICRKTFITTSALNRHQTIHTEGKHFICNYCGKSFKWMESLGRHMRCIHKRENMPV